jgi:DNA-binding NarL/FixJ family response regulator
MCKHRVMHAARKRAVVVSADLLIRRGVSCLLEAHTHVEVVSELGTPGGVIHLSARLRPDVVVLDAIGPVSRLLASLPALARLCRVVMLINAPDPALVEAARRSGVSVLLRQSLTTNDLLLACGEALGGSVNPVKVLSVPTRPSSAIGTLPRRHSPAASGVTIPSGSSPCRRDLTPRESDVMAAIARGVRNSDIAATLNVSEKTVKNHINRIFAKLQVDSRAKAIVFWLGDS